MIYILAHELNAYYSYYCFRCYNVCFLLCKYENIGEPECATSFGGRERKDILPAHVQSKASDHEFHVVSLTPRVSLVVDFDGGENIGEEERLASFYRGNAHVCLKDSIFQSSNVERHVVELISLLKKMHQGAQLLARLCVS